MESIICKSANEAVSAFERDRVLIDIAYNVGAQRLTNKYEIDSRLLVKEIIAWTELKKPVLFYGNSSKYRLGHERLHPDGR